MLLGCGGGSSTTQPGPPVVPTFTTIEVSGSVDGAVIGGENLEVVSAWAEPVLVSQDTFTTSVSETGAQLLFLLDGIGSPRGLALSLPDGAKSTAASAGPRFDARSTALGALFLTPGLLAVDPDTARARCQEIETYVSYQDLEVYVAGNLSTRTLVEINEDNEYLELLGACIQEWFDNNPVLPPDDPDPKQEPFSSVVVDYTIEGLGLNTTLVVEEDDFPDRLKLILENHAHRFIHVTRRDVDTDGAHRDTVLAGGLAGVMPGRVGVSIGSILTSTTGDPATRNDDISFRTCSRKDAEYWILGPGFSESLESVPPDLDLGDIAPVLNSTVLYGVLPALSVVFGLGSLGNLGSSGLVQEAFVLCGELQTGTSFGLLVDAFLNSEGTIDRQRAFIDMVSSILSKLVAEEAIQSFLTRMGVSSSLTMGAAFVVTVLDACLNLYNMIATVTQWAIQCPVEVLYVKGGGVRWGVGAYDGSIKPDFEDTVRCYAKVTDMNDEPLAGQKVSFSVEPAENAMIQACPTGQPVGGFSFEQDVFTCSLGEAAVILKVYERETPDLACITAALVNDDSGQVIDAKDISVQVRNEPCEGGIFHYAGWRSQRCCPSIRLSSQNVAPGGTITVSASWPEDTWEDGLCGCSRYVCCSHAVDVTGNYDHIGGSCGVYDYNYWLYPQPYPEDGLAVTLTASSPGPVTFTIDPDILVNRCIAVDDTTADYTRVSGPGVVVSGSGAPWSTVKMFVIELEQ